MAKSWHILVMKLLCCVCEIVLLTLFSMLASPGLQSPEREDGSRAFGLILNSVLEGYIMAKPGSLTYI